MKYVKFSIDNASSVLGINTLTYTRLGSPVSETLKPTSISVSIFSSTILRKCTQYDLYPVELDFLAQLLPRKKDK